MKKKDFLFASFVFGDMNFRSRYTCVEAEQLINKYFEEKDLKNQLSLIKKIQRKEEFTYFLEQNMLKDNYYFQEREITFLPSYKRLNDKKLKFDYGNGKRVPSWTDRIMYNVGKLPNFKVKGYYIDEDTIFSDHRPVFMLCECDIQSIDYEKLLHLNY